MDPEIIDDPLGARVTCEWCEKLFTRDPEKPYRVCTRCYQLLSRAGVSDDEIFGVDERKKDALNHSAGSPEIKED